MGLAVDGPRGPRRRAGQAPIRLARQAGAALVPVAASARRGLRLATWDRFLVPAPFTTIVVVFGEPLGADQLVQGGLDRATERACALAGS